MKRVIVFLITNLFFLSFCHISCADEINIDVAHAFYTYAAEKYKSTKDSDIKLRPVSTSEAFRHLIDGSADAIIATAPSQEQKKWIEESGKKISSTELFREPLLILVNDQNPVESLTTDELTRIYCDEASGWDAFADFFGNVNTYQLEKNNGSQTAFESIVPENELGEHHFEIGLMNEIIDCVAADPLGICYSFSSYYFTRHPAAGCHPINIDGRACTSEDYPLQFAVCLFYDSEATLFS